MDLNPVILAIPMYFILMAIEIIYEKIKHKESYRINDSLTNISTGVLQQLTNTFISLFKIGIYTWVYYNFALQEIPQNVWSFFLALALWDLCYYWEHRMAHSVNLFWGGHIVHHQSEEYNLSVALRQTSTGFIWGFPFYLPMALLGIHPIQFVLVGGINLLYQFWIHTEHIKKLPGIVESVFNTPSHHRVHHGRDPKYIDKNYAGIFIIWDRIFNTFQKEEERPHYGITTPLRSWNPVYANFSHYIHLVQWMKDVRSFKDALLLLVKKPGWFPSYMGGSEKLEAVPDNYVKYDKKISSIQYYILFQFLIALILNSFYFFNHGNFDLVEKSIFAVWIIVSTLLFGLMLEHRNLYISIAETIRLCTIPWMLYRYIFPELNDPIIVILVSSLFLILSLFYYFKALKNSEVKDQAIAKDLPS